MAFRVIGRCVVRVALFGSVAMLAHGCGGQSEQDLSSVAPYAEMIGAEYEVLADNLELYGVYGFDNPSVVAWLTLVPPPGFDGSEVAFRCPIPAGQRFRITAVRKRPVLLDSDIYYLVDLLGATVPERLPIELPLLRGNQGEGHEPNARLYRRIGRSVASDRTAAGADRPAVTCPVANGTPNFMRNDPK